MAKKEKVRQPMLAVEADLYKIKFPVIASPKLDGYRILTVLEDGQVKAKTRKFLELPNHHVRKMIESLPPGLDGELIHPSMDFGEQGAYRRFDGQPEFHYYVFDFACSQDEKMFCLQSRKFAGAGFEIPFEVRSRRLKMIVDGLNLPWLKFVEQVVINDQEELDAICKQHLQEGFEGTMIRDPNGAYKFGRSTVKEGGLLKIKQWADAEAEVIGFVERMHNANEAEKNAFGRTKRSKKQENMIGLNTLGAFVCRDLKTGVVFNLPGKTDEFNQEVWNNQPKYLGAILTYEYQPAGMDEAPRFPGFKAWRPDWDMG